MSDQSALITRPTFHTFHSALSRTFTIGTSPWDASCKRRRKAAAAAAMNRPAVQTYMPIIDLESNASIKEIIQDSKSDDINPSGYFQRFALNTSLTLNYGMRISGRIDNEFLKELVFCEREIGQFRSTSHNWQDYIPLLRLWPFRDKKAQEIQARRNNYMNYFLNELKARIANGTDKPCITGNVLKDPDAKLSHGTMFDCIEQLG